MREYGRLLGMTLDGPRAEAFERRVVDMSEVLATPESLERLGPLLGDAPGLQGPITWDARATSATASRSAHNLASSTLSPESNASPSTVRSPAAARPGSTRCSGQRTASRSSSRSGGLRRSGRADPRHRESRVHQQWQVGVRRAGLDVEVVHLAEALDRALDG